MLTCSQENMQEKIQNFSEFGKLDNGGITRYAFSEADIAARNEFIRRMKQIHAIIEIDDVGNIYATLPGSNLEKKRIVMGSHTDSVKNGGNYDGILGVLSAMEVLETIVREQIQHEHPITAMVWTNEEGSLYPPSLMCSGIVCYDYLPPEIQQKYQYQDMMKSQSLEDKQDTFGDALTHSGFRGNKEFRLSRERDQCMFETHIEQGPILDQNHKEIGVVDCVIGLMNYRVMLRGQTVHAGTFPMDQRKDAFWAAANVLQYLHHEIDQLQILNLVYTTGEVICHPDIHTCVPDYFEFSLDVRHQDPENLKKVLAILKDCTKKKWNGCDCEIRECWTRETVSWDPDLVSFVKAAAQELGADYQTIHSGAGHDAQYVGYMLPTTMIFVPSKNGLSHCIEEYSSARLCTLGASVMLNAVLLADQKLK